ncbi:uncharacterized protein LOC133896328 [Phragmites australis]|uniref:uncharacterized protein LOC133896328 n=1 Tax=Phragmites australis TaxID=29695 RepID=UPI002D77C86C|nr:uncharacterized protein LOC133896328 [Phragmites australis]
MATPATMVVSDNTRANTTVDQGQLGRGEKLLYPICTAATAAEQGAAYCKPGMHVGKAIPLAPQIVADKATAAGVGHDMNELAERVLRGLPILGLTVASSAVTGLTTGAPTPAMGFGLFLMMLVGLSAVSIRVLRA